MNTTEDVLKEQADLLVKKSLTITKLKNQINSLLSAIENNPHPCDHGLIREIKSAEEFVEIIK